MVLFVEIEVGRHGQFFSGRGRGRGRGLLGVEKGRDRGLNRLFSRGRPLLRRSQFPSFRAQLTRDFLDRTPVHGRSWISEIRSERDDDDV